MEQPCSKIIRMRPIYWATLYHCKKRLTALDGLIEINPKSTILFTLEIFVNTSFNVVFKLTIQFLVTIAISATFKDYVFWPPLRGTQGVESTHSVRAALSIVSRSLQAGTGCLEKFVFDEFCVLCYTDNNFICRYLLDNIH